MSTENKNIKFVLYLYEVFVFMECSTVCIICSLEHCVWLFNWFPHVVPEHLQVKNGCLEGKSKHAMNIFPLWLIASDAVVNYKETNEVSFHIRNPSLLRHQFCGYHQVKLLDSILHKKNKFDSIFENSHQH